MSYISFFKEWDSLPYLVFFLNIFIAFSGQREENHKDLVCLLEPEARKDYSAVPSINEIAFVYTSDSQSTIPRT